MDRARHCPECGSRMETLDEKHEAGGTTVTYVCRNGACRSVQRGFPAKEKVFEAR